MRKWSALLAVVSLAGCDHLGEATGAFAAANIAAIPVFGRTIPDLVYSAATGKDCSIVRLDKGERYCRRPDGPPERPPACTRSLGLPECWSNPEALPANTHFIADQQAPTAEQEEHRNRRWPGL